MLMWGASVKYAAITPPMRCWMYVIADNYFLTLEKLGERIYKSVNNRMTSIMNVLTIIRGELY